MKNNPTINPGMSDQTGILIADRLDSLAAALLDDDNLEGAVRPSDTAQASAIKGNNPTVNPRMSDQTGMLLSLIHI